MSTPSIVESVESEENGKLVYMAAVPMALDQAPSSMLDFKLIVKNNGGATEQLDTPVQSGNPRPLVFSFDRDLQLRLHQIKRRKPKSLEMKKKLLFRFLQYYKFRLACFSMDMTS